MPKVEKTTPNASIKYLYKNLCVSPYRNLCSEGVIITYHLIELLVLICKISPFTIVFKALDVLWSELHLSEFLWEMLCAVFVIKLWLVWSSLLLLIYGVPVYAFEPRVCHDVLSVTWA